MAKPASRTDLVNYCKRQLGAPVLEINIADEQVDDLVDDALQIFHERDYDGLTQTFLKYKITQEELKNVDQVSFFQNEPKWYIDILVKNPNILIQKLRTHGIQARRFYRPLHQQPLYKSSKKNFKNSNSLYDHGIWLPSTTNISDEELVYVAKKIKESLSN